MLISRNDIIVLKNLLTAKDLVAVDSIPYVFKHDFDLYFFGKTLMKDGNKLLAYPHDVKGWVNFMFNKYQ